MRVKYIIVYLLNFIVAFKFPDGASMSHKLKHLELNTNHRDVKNHLIN